MDKLDLDVGVDIDAQCDPLLEILKREICVYRELQEAIILEKDMLLKPFSGRGS